jgi:hypothetical protein
MTNLPIPAAALDDRLAFVGTAGSGKTYAAGTAAERLLHEKKRVGIIDPLGVWYGLRLLADGVTPSNWPVVIFGGPHGDLPINDRAGALIGETVATMKESWIIDLSELGTKAAERRFMLPFLEALYRKTSGDPLHTLFDEADMWAPQKLMDKEGDAAKLLGMMETICRRGRVKGFIPWLITQRPAVLSKDVLSQADGLIAMKLVSSQDRDALGAWIEGQADRAQQRDLLAMLPQLTVGKAVVWLPGHGVLEQRQFPAKVTFDSSRTPKRGEKRVARELKPLDVGALRGRIEKVQVEADANDPKKLKAKIAELQREVARKPAPPPVPKVSPPDPAVLEAAEQRGYLRGVFEGEQTGFDAAVAQMGSSISNVASDVRAIARRATDMEKHFAAISREWRKRPRPKGNSSATKPSAAKPLQAERTILPAPAQRSSTAPTLAHERARQTPQQVANANASHGLEALSNVVTGPQLQLLKSLAWWRAMGHDAPLRQQIAAIAGWKAGGSNLRNRLSELTALGFVSYPSQGRVALTETGAATAPAPDLGADLLTSVRAIMTGPQSAIFDVLVPHRTEALARTAIAEQLGWEAGGSNLRNRLSELSALDVVHYPGKGEVALSDWLFP